MWDILLSSKTVDHRMIVPQTKVIPSHPSLNSTTSPCPQPLYWFLIYLRDFSFKYKVILITLSPSFTHKTHLHTLLSWLLRVITSWLLLVITSVYLHGVTCLQCWSTLRFEVRELCDQFSLRSLLENNAVMNSPKHSSSCVR